MPAGQGPEVVDHRLVLQEVGAERHSYNAPDADPYARNY